MSLATIFRGAADAILSAHPELAVAVVYGGTTTTGMKATVTGDAALANMGETGQTTGQVRVSAAAISEPAEGGTITVGGVACFVTGVETDGAGAFYVIQYAKQKPK
jgi:hypothetical protein